MKKGILMVLLVAGVFLLGTGTFVQESDAEVIAGVESLQEGEMQIFIEPVSVEEQSSEAIRAMTIQLNEIAAEVSKLTLLVNKSLQQSLVEPVAVEDQNSAVLQEIAVQIQGVEAEVNRISLLINKVVLQQQALALQGQLDEIAGIQQVGQEQAGEANTGGLSETVVLDENAGILTIEEFPSGAGTGNLAEDNLLDRNVADEIDELPIPIVATDDENNGGGGLLAGVQNAVGNMGTPEIVTVLILAVLAIFVILRRIISRGRVASVSIPVNSVIETEDENEAIDEKRQEIREKVAWK